MKKTIVNWGIAVSLFTYLFYEQIQWYNTIVFSATLIGLVAHTHPALLALSLIHISMCISDSRFPFKSMS